MTPLSQPQCHPGFRDKRTCCCSALLAHATHENSASPCPAAMERVTIAFSTNVNLPMFSKLGPRPIGVTLFAFPVVLFPRYC
ncbi:hypothetical protein O3P69_012895 [Scylla paramamosain]|uniref:Uncharacterized protein n=1 Tax=Scylla paramamosain TaxID=85552 RepID=A0AAW0TQJ5_SCYPA